MSYKAGVIAAKGSSLEVREKSKLAPGENEVLIKVHACGLCHSDCFVSAGVMTPAEKYPLAPGHEAAGEIVELGPGALSEAWKVGDRVAVGWYGGACLGCSPCRAGEMLLCTKHLPVTGIARDGGYGEFMVARAEACAKIPDGMDYTQAGPLVCAGVTVFNGLRQNTRYAPAGSVVGVVGIGGLGHLGVQFANKMGYKVVAISRGQAKKQDALALGAHEYIDSTSQDVAAELQKLGGAKIILVTATGNHEVIASYIGGLAYDGVILLAGVDDTMQPIPVNAMSLLSGRKSIRGVMSGHAHDSEDTMNFAHQAGVKVKTQVFPFSKIVEAYETMASGKGNLRVVVTYDA